MISLYSGRVEDGDVLKRLSAWLQRGSARFSELYRRIYRQFAHVRDTLKDESLNITNSFSPREETKASLVLALESLTAGLLILDRNLHTRFTNRRFHELLGGLDGTFAVQLISERLAECLRQKESSVLPFTRQHSFLDTNGSPTLIHISVSEIRDENEDGGGYIFVLQDISHLEQKETAATPTSQHDMLDAIAMEIMHEVRNPLGSIALYASLIQEQPTGETTRWASEILRASRRLQTTIAQLLSFATDPRLATEWLPVTTLIQEVTDATFPVWYSGRWKLETKVQEDLPLLWGDRTLLAQALTNLLTNATEAMPHGGTVTIRAYQTMSSVPLQQGQRVVAIQVEDEGSGIAPHDREKIFTPFFTTKRSGTGIGLALTQKIIHAHLGTIEIADAPVRGCCFTVFLPVKDPNGFEYALTGSTRHLTHDEARESI